MIQKEALVILGDWNKLVLHLDIPSERACCQMKSHPIILVSVLRVGWENKGTQLEKRNFEIPERE